MTSKAELDAWFDKFDDDKSGKIDKSELADALKSYYTMMGQDTSESAVRAAADVSLTHIIVNTIIYQLWFVSFIEL